MRRALLATAFTLSMTLSIGAYAQQADLVETWHNCNASRFPDAGDVYVFDDVNGGGTCSGLSLGFYPNPGSGPGTFGLGNDKIKSLRVGSGARIRLFTDVVYGGGVATYSQSQTSLPNGVSGTTSSIRVESSGRALDCSDLQANEFALFRDANFGSDCVKLNYDHMNTYLEPVNMGIANDAVSSVKAGPLEFCSNGSQKAFVLYKDGNFGGNNVIVFSGSANDVSFLSTFNDQTSSVQTVCAFH